ncbi:kinase-like protein, partial [Glonium stellatum]
RLLRSLGCLAGAVTYFHGEGIKHKDMKHSNVLLSRGGGLWVTDFESSTDFTYLTSSVTGEGERGTPKYFAPEVAARELCGRPADIFALGCVFLEII